MYTSSISAAGTLTGGSVDDSRTMLFKQSLPKLQAPPSPVSTAGAGAGSAGQSSPAAYTPRKYLKILSHVLKTLVKHHAKLSVEFLEALKVCEGRGGLDSNCCAEASVEASVCVCAGNWQCWCPAQHSSVPKGTT